MVCDSSHTQKQWTVQLFNERYAIASTGAFFFDLEESSSLLVSDNAEKYRLRSRILIESESGVTITERHKSTTQTQNGSS